MYWSRNLAHSHILKEVSSNRMRYSMSLVICFQIISSVYNIKIVASAGAILYASQLTTTTKTTCSLNS